MIPSEPTRKWNNLIWFTENYKIDSRFAFYWIIVVVVVVVYLLTMCFYVKNTFTKTKKEMINLNYNAFT